jgi:peptidoglycan/xylan/chitin deacetylase (PgdA/CDA1 family)
MKTKTYILKIILILIVLSFLSFLFNTPKTVLLSFDTEIQVGDENATLKILEILKDNNAKATFFVMGTFAKNNPEIIKKMMSQGCEVACHTQNHKLLTKLNYEEIDDELRLCKENIQNITIEAHEIEDFRAQKTNESSSETNSSKTENVSQEEVGFRAPWRRMNTNVFRALKENNFSYDSSYYTLQPRRPRDMKEVKTSMFGIIPSDDYMNLKFLHIPKQIYFFLSKHTNNDVASMSYHPHIIIQYEQEFKSLIEYFNQKNITFLTHQELID